MKREKQKVLVLGSTGAIGSIVLEKLLQADEIETIYAVARRPLSIQSERLVPLINENILKIDFDELDVDSLIIAFGTTIKTAGSQEKFKAIDVDLPLNVARQLKDKGLKNIFLVSSIGADAKSPMFYAKMKGVLEEKLERMRVDRLVIFRPSLLLGKRSEFRPAELVGQWVSILLIPFLPAVWRPIRFQRLAQGIVNLVLKEEESSSHSVEVFQGRRLFSAGRKR